MYEKKLDLKTENKCNYVIEISPSNNSELFFSLNNQGYIIEKEKFLSLKKNEINDELKIKQNSNEPQEQKYSYLINDPEDTITCSHFSYESNNNFIILSDETKTISKYKYKKENEEINTNNNKNIEKNKIEINKLKTWKFNLSLDNKKLVTGDNNITIYDLENKKVIKEIESKSKFIYSFCFLNQNILSVGNSNGAVQIFDIESENQLHKFEEHCLTVRNLAYNKNRNILYSASDDLHINLIDINTNKLYSPIIGHKEPISDMVYNEDKKLLITSSFDGVIKIWDTNNNNNCIETLELNDKSTIWDIAVSNNADFIAYTAIEGIGAYLRK